MLGSMPSAFVPHARVHFCREIDLQIQNIVTNESPVTACAEPVRRNGAIVAPPPKGIGVD
jgi:hypothetical protein